MISVRNYLTVVLYGFLGQLGCWGLMIGGQAITTLENALIIHAFGAPIIFGTLSSIYITRINRVRPLLVATIFVAVVMFVDFFVVALMINHSLAMFYSLIGTWIPFTLIFVSSYLVGIRCERSR